MHAVIGSALAIGSIELIHRFALPQVANALMWLPINLSASTYVQISLVMLVFGLIRRRRRGRFRHAPLPEGVAPEAFMRSGKRKHIEMGTRNARILRMLVLCIAACLLFSAGFLLRGNAGLMGAWVSWR